MIEAWRPIKGFEGLYEVSNLGHVRRLIWRQGTCAKFGGRKHRQPKILKQGARGSCRYNTVTLTDLQGKRHGRLVHRLVLEAFIGSCPPHHQAAHNDGNRFNNDVSNLRWTTPRDNCNDMIRHGTKVCGERHPQSHLTEDEVREMRTLSCNGVSQKELASRFGVQVPSISRIVNHKRWASTGGTR